MAVTFVGAYGTPGIRSQEDADYAEYIKMTPMDFLAERLGMDTQELQDDIRAENRKRGDHAL
jgi:hypothetical protein